MDFSIEPTSYICLNVPRETVSPKKIAGMLVLPHQLFPDSSSIAFHLKNNSIPKSKFRKILVENTSIIVQEIDKLRLQILEFLHIKTKQKNNKINRINFENSEDVLKWF